MDLISRQAAIEAVHKSIFDFFDICDDDEESPMTYKDELLLELNKAITTQIKAVASAQPIEAEPRWIPVTERLPKETGTYLVTLEYKEHGTGITTLWFHGSLGWDLRVADVVTAWMPLPGSYREVEE
jgi:hypothetical protein